jgi:tRNA-Thr(GGU) m(6)t(6)A37 methyltransferase TsaA
MLKPYALMSKNNQEIVITPIGTMRTPYGQKFAVPRQPGLAPHALGVIEFFKPYGVKEAFGGLEGFSHIHILFVFDKAPYANFHATVRPPRLGGNTSCGVFASRSPFRPSSIGLSTVKLVEILEHEGEVSLVVEGADLVDGTPIIDIKPYIPFVDAIPNALGGFASKMPPQYPVHFSDEAKLKLADLGERRLLAITETLAQDPRPAYKDDNDDKVYYALIYNRDVMFRVKNSVIEVIDVIVRGEPSC